MLNLLKIKRFFSPMAVVFISILLTAVLSKILGDSNHSALAFIIFYSLFLYWAVALVFIVSRFLKNRQPT